MISAAELNAIEAEAKEAGVAGSLSKPLFKSTVAESINRYLSAALAVSGETQTKEELSLNGSCLLLVEDIEINSEIIMAMLEPTCLEIDCAENGVKAVHMFRENPERYDVIFMDVQMPEMDGYEATRQIRALGTSRAAGVPIIAMTANVFREDIEKCLDSGMNDHIGKPIDFHEVFEKLRIYLLPQR
jgi:CheY-like chemotaxis protein